MSASLDGRDPGGGWSAGHRLWVGLWGSTLELEAVAPVNRVVPAQQHCHETSFPCAIFIIILIFLFGFSSISIH